MLSPARAIELRHAVWRDFGSKFARENCHQHSISVSKATLG
jgi:hypothetical protein